MAVRKKKPATLPASVTRTTMPLSKLCPAPYNPRQISDRALAGLRASIDRFGIVQEIVVNRRSGNVVGGHQRLKVLEALGVKDVPVAIVDLPEREEQALNIALNSPAIAGEFTDDLGALLAGIERDLPELFEALRLDDLWEGLSQEPKGGLTDPDAVPEPPKKAITKPGNLWILGNHRILCGDSTKPEDVARVMGGARAKLVFTDPPYGVAYRGRGKETRKQTIENDDLDPGALRQFLFAAFVAIPCDDACNIYVCHAHSKAGVRPAFEFAFLDAGFTLGATIIWVKQAASMGWQDYRHQHEPILFGWNKGENRMRVTDRTQTTVWEINRDAAQDYEHPTQKPVALIERAMVNSSLHGAAVYDGFLGSGSTLIAAERMDRRCFGLEIDPIYVDVCVARWEQFTGRKAERERA